MLPLKEIKIENKEVIVSLFKITKKKQKNINDV